MIRPLPRNKVALIDTGFWYALFEERDQHHREAQAKVESLMGLSARPTVAGSLRDLATCFIRCPLQVPGLRSFLKRPNAVLLDDGAYKRQALDNTLSSARGRERAFSLVTTS